MKKYLSILLCFVLFVLVSCANAAGEVKPKKLNQIYGTYELESYTYTNFKSEITTYDRKESYGIESYLVISENHTYFIYKDNDVFLHAREVYLTYNTTDKGLVDKIYFDSLSPSCVYDYKMSPTMTLFVENDGLSYEYKENNKFSRKFSYKYKSNNTDVTKVLDTKVPVLDLYDSAFNCSWSARDNSIENAYEEFYFYVDGFNKKVYTYAKKYNDNNFTEEVFDYTITGESTSKNSHTIDLTFNGLIFKYSFGDYYIYEGDMIRFNHLNSISAYSLNELKEFVNNNK